MNNEQINWLTHAWQREQDSFDTTFRIDGWNVCESCLTGMYRISGTTWGRRKAQVKSGTRHWQHASTGHEPRLSQKGYASRVWMADHFFTLGDFQPDTGQVHLPPCDKKDIHKEMVADLDKNAVSLGQFYQIWKADFSDVKVPAQQRLGKCDSCSTFHDQIVSERDPVAREKIKLDRSNHLKDVKADRMVYHTLRQQAREESDKYIVLILDGMDQSKTNIPCFNNGEASTYMTVRVIGAIVHGAVKQTYAYLVTDFTKETNTMVEVLRRTLDAQATLPPTLYLQLDNTSQENKNSHMFAYLAELVETRVFRKIVVNFLPVGHTHVSFVLCTFDMPREASLD